jgi:GTPase SAR1 family protein
MGEGGPGVEEPVFIYIVGTAGSGKTTLTAAYSEWLRTLGLDSIKVNMDPGAEDLPYRPEVDIREYISLPAIMEEHGLGPNGAQIAAADMISLHLKDIKHILSSFRTPYILVDTPGQIELFAFRKASTLMMNTLDPDRSVIAFTLDPILCKLPSGLVSCVLLSTTVQFRMGVPTINLLTKCDLLSEVEMENIRAWTADPITLEGAIYEERSTAQSQVNLEIAKGLTNLGILANIIPVSSTTRFGMEDLYNFIQQLFIGGEDERPD